MRKQTWLRLLLILAILTPLAFLFLLLSGGMMTGSMWLWLALILCFALIWNLVGTPSEPEATPAPAGPQMLPPEQQPPAVREIMEVRMATDLDGVQAFRGPLKEPPDAAFEKLKHNVGPGIVPLIQPDEQLGASVTLLPTGLEQTALEHRIFPRFNWILLALTLVTTTWAGAAYLGVDLLREPARFRIGLPYSLGRLAILGIHELGHYFTARHHGIRVTPPYFIPVPFALGTFGAFIQMKSPTEDRHALFDVAVAGPLAGLAVAVPALLIGLHYSQVIVPGAAVQPGMLGGTSVGSSILFALLAKLSLGQSLDYGHLVRLHPLAFAGWLGLFVTALNLLPIGQLDGGHMARAMFGSRTGGSISSIALWTLFLLAVFVWPGLFLWVIIVFFIAGRGAPPLNDMTPISVGRRWIGYATFTILLLIIAPLPHALWSDLGIHCPYL
jgi:membrane-associated protease RseP (regulator of RpoE activity)